MSGVLPITGSPPGPTAGREAVEQMEECSSIHGEG
jgi:hypothetical protein